MAPDAVQAEQVALHKATFEAQMHARCAQLDAGAGKVKFLSRLKRDRIGHVLRNWAAWSSRERQAQVNTPGYSQAYHWNTTFRLVTIGGNEVVVFPFEPGTPLQQLQQVCCREDSFDAIHTTHTEHGHIKGQGLYEAVKSRYGHSIPKWVVEMYVKLCPICQRNRPRKTSSAGHQPILTKGFGSRAQVCLALAPASLQCPFLMPSAAVCHRWTSSTSERRQTATSATSSATRTTGSSCTRTAR